MRIGGLTDTQYSGFFKELWLADISRNIQHLEELLDTYESSPSFWAADVLKRIEAYQDLALLEDLDIPYELRSGRSPNEARALTRKLFHRFGQLLYWWPVLVEAAREIRESGMSFMTEL
jgi:hypothetical protein